MPVLPLKFVSKLFLPLCETCVEVKHVEVFDKLVLEAEIKLDDHQVRVFPGTFVTAELKLALLKGYRMVDASENLSWRIVKR